MYPLLDGGCICFNRLCIFFTVLKSSLHLLAKGHLCMSLQSRVEYSNDSSCVFKSSSCIVAVSWSLTWSEIAGCGYGVGIGVVPTPRGLGVCVFSELSVPVVFCFLLRFVPIFPSPHIVYLIHLDLNLDLPNSVSTIV